MLIEALEPIRVKFPEGEQRLVPGQSYDLPEAQAQKLMTKAHGKIRILSDAQTAFALNANLPHDGQSSDPQDFYPSGTRITYQSPLFGELEAEIIEDKGACVWIWHAIRECEACIPRGWVIDIQKGESASK